MVLKGEEACIQDSIRVALAQAGYIVFRANVGKVKQADGRWFDTGLPKGFFDLFGFEHDNGKIFFLEIKNEKGRVREDQKQFHRMLTKYGIIHGVARSPEDALKIVSEELVGYGF